MKCIPRQLPQVGCTSTHLRCAVRTVRQHTVWPVIPHNNPKSLPPEVQPKCTQRAESHEPRLLALAASPFVLNLLLTSSSQAAQICIDVPDWAVDVNPVDLLLHSPYIILGLAALALVLLPKVIKVGLTVHISMVSICDFH